MVLDSSALLAILLDEPERKSFIDSIEASAQRSMSVVSLVESGIVLESRRGSSASSVLDAFVMRAGIEVVSVDAEQGRAARQAFSRFGKGRHAAGLNFGDCFAYALAHTTGDPLLYKGNDFSKTDVTSADY